MKPTKKRQQEIIEADILLVTSQEIDRRGEETEDEEEARRFMDDVLEKLRRGIRRLGVIGGAAYGGRRRSRAPLRRRARRGDED